MSQCINKRLFVFCTAGRIVCTLFIVSQKGKNYSVFCHMFLLLVKKLKKANAQARINARADNNPGYFFSGLISAELILCLVMSNLRHYFWKIILFLIFKIYLPQQNLNGLKCNKSQNARIFMKNEAITKDLPSTKYLKKIYRISPKKILGKFCPNKISFEC